LARTKTIPARIPRITPTQPMADMLSSNMRREMRTIGILFMPPTKDMVDPEVSWIVKNAEAQTAVVRAPESTKQILKVRFLDSNASKTAGTSLARKEAGRIRKRDRKLEWKVLSRLEALELCRHILKVSR